MTAGGTNGDDAVQPEATRPTGPVASPAGRATGEWKPGSPLLRRPVRGAEERPDGRQPDTAAPAARSASTSAGNARPSGPVPSVAAPASDGGGRIGRPGSLRPGAGAFANAARTSAERAVTPSTPDRPGPPAGQDGGEPPDPSDGRQARGRRTKVLVAVVGVVAVALIALPFLNRDKGSEDDQSKTAATASNAPNPRDSLLGVPGGLESASAAAKKHKAKKDKDEEHAGNAISSGAPLPQTSQNPSGHPFAAHPSSGASKPTSPTKTAPGSAKATEHAAAGNRTTAEATLVIQPIAKLEPATSWKTTRLQLGMQADGNLVLYDRQEKRVIWAVGTSGKGNVAYFQSDGNLVIYTAAGRAIWASNPAGFTDATLNIRPNGNLDIMAGNKQVWTSNSHI